MRQATFGLALAIFALGSGDAALADRYVNETGLAPKRFVWSPSVAPSGPLTVVVTPAKRTAHVYRGGIEIGIASITPAAAATTASGVYLISEVEGLADASSRKLLWRGTELLGGGSAGSTAPEAMVALPLQFAKLLSEASHPGAAVIVAHERTGLQLFSAPGPFTEEIETGSVDRVSRFAQPELRNATPPEQPQANSAQAKSSNAHDSREAGATAQVTSLILSRADLSAYVVRNGNLVDRLPIAVDDPTRPFGFHAAVLVSATGKPRDARWMAVGLDDDAAASHIVSDRAEAEMRRVHFMDRGRTATLARTLRPGTVVVLADGHGPSATQPARFDVALLSTDEMVAAAPPPATEVSKPKVSPSTSSAKDRKVVATHPKAKRVMPAVKISKTRARLRTATSRRAPRGPLDEREDWPNGMYWPY